VKPNYTSESMRAKIQGAVLLECVVNASGEGDLRDSSRQRRLPMIWCDGRSGTNAQSTRAANG
jgi:hypothetical protein